MADVLGLMVDGKYISFKTSFSNFSLTSNLNPIKPSLVDLVVRLNTN